MSITANDAYETMIFDERDDMPSISTTTSDGMPVLSTSTDSYTTPSVGVPSSGTNPYISRSSKPSGTVFIAVGSVVAFILLMFALVHLIKSIVAASMAKKTVNNEKYTYQRFAQNNNVAYGTELTPSNSAFFNTEYQGAGGLPLLNNKRVVSVFGTQAAGDTSTIDMSEAAGPAASNLDLTEMFISPTKEMSSNRIKSHGFHPSVSNFSLPGSSVTNLSQTNRYSSQYQNLFVDDDIARSDYTSSPALPKNPGAGNGKKRAVPSVYLNDLIDN